MSNLEIEGGQPGEQPIEQTQPSRINLGEAREGGVSRQEIEDMYQLAEEVFTARVEHLKEIGAMRRVLEIADEEELDDHFDHLARVYKQVCFEIGLPWPPLALDDEVDIDN